MADVADLSSMSSSHPPSSEALLPPQRDTPDAGNIVLDSVPNIVSTVSPVEERPSEYRYWKRLTFNFSEEVILPSYQRVERMELYGAVMTFDKEDNPDWCPPITEELLERSPPGAPRRTFRSRILGDQDYTLHDPKDARDTPYIVMHPAVFGAKVIEILKSVFPKVFKDELVKESPEFNCELL